MKTVQCGEMEWTSGKRVFRVSTSKTANGWDVQYQILNNGKEFESGIKACETPRAVEIAFRDYEALRSQKRFAAASLTKFPT